MYLFCEPHIIESYYVQSFPVVLLSLYILLGRFIQDTAGGYTPVNVNIPELIRVFWLFNTLYSKKSLHIWKCFPLFSSRNLIFLPFLFRSLFHIKQICVYGIGKRPHFCFSHMATQIPELFTQKLPPRPHTLFH